MNEINPDILTCALERWSPKIGDPTAIGWLTVAVYALAGVVAFLVAIKGGFPIPSRRRERFFWFLLGLAFVALAVNKQLDLQSFVTAVGRCIAKLDGWYKDRRAFQLEVIVGLVLAMALAAALLWRLMRGTLRRNGVALAGMVFVLAFVAVRAVGFHHVDVLINLHVMDIRMNWLLELPGPLLILLNGFVLLIWRLGPDEDTDSRQNAFGAG